MKCIEHHSVLVIIINNFIVPLNLLERKRYLRFFQVFVVVNKIVHILFKKKSLPLFELSPNGTAWKV
jgi:hypothetical protein